MSNTQDIFEFSRSLISTRDLDPVYVLLHEADLDRELLQRWLLAYWCYYHVGTASWISDVPDYYWTRMKLAAKSKEYPRCHERRHFRGNLSIKTVDWLEQRGIESLFKQLVGRSLELSVVMKLVKQWYGFGDWIAFKVADMLERLGISAVEFNSGAMFLFDSPREGAELMWEKHGNGHTENKQLWAVATILKEVGYLDAPPRYERKLNSQEAETCLCKWKSYMGGHYKIGEDIQSCRSGLLKFTLCKTSQRLFAAGRSAGLWN